MKYTIILSIIALILALPSVILLFILKKDRKKYFIISSIFTILISYTFFEFGENLLKILHFNSGTINHTVYLYKYIFMFSPILSLFFVSIHKLFAHKKQLICLVALKYILPIFLGFILVIFLPLSKVLWFLAIYDMLITLGSFTFAILLV